MSATAVRPTPSPAYQPRSFRTASPAPPVNPHASTSSVRTLTPRLGMEHPLPSRPTTPMPPSQTPRLGADRIAPSISSSSSAPAGDALHSSGPGSGMGDRKGSSLRNEVSLGTSRPGSPIRKSLTATARALAMARKRSSGEVEEGEVREVTEEMKQNAKEIVKLLSSLPAPLPEVLPPTFLPTPRPTPSPSPESFATYARSLSASTSPRSSTSSSSALGKRLRSSSPGGGGGAGLGLGLVDAAKRAKGKGGVSMTPTMSTFGGKTVSPELRRVQSGGSAKVPATTSKEVMEGKETWSKAKWASAANSYKARAILLKRHGDAHLRLTGAKPQVLHLAADTLLGLLCLTDAVLLWLYAYWCDEQAEGRVKMTPYRDSQALRDFVRGEWEKWVRRGWSGYGEGLTEEEKEGLRDMGKGMIGLMYLIEAVVYYHLSAEQLHHLNRRSAQINALASSSAAMAPSHSANGASTPSVNGQTAQPTGTGASNSNSASTNHPSAVVGGHNASPSNSGESPSNNSVGPSPHSATSSSLHQHPEIPSEIMGLISTSASQSSRAASNLLNSRHHLPLSLLRARFPNTYELAITSELADESLPPPNDSLGAARKVDIDALERFVWPIELGMCAPLAHLAVFGRALVRETAETTGKEWDTRVGATQ